MSDVRPISAADWVLLAIVCACQFLAGLLELFFLAQFYLGTVLIPLVIIVAIVGNIALPRWGFQIVGRTAGVALPMICWLIPVLGLTMYTRPEGDVFVLGELGQQYAYFGMLLVGAVAGFSTVVINAGRTTATRR